MKSNLAQAGFGSRLHVSRGLRLVRSAHTELPTVFIHCYGALLSEHIMFLFWSVLFFLFLHKIIHICSRPPYLRISALTGIAFAPENNSDYDDHNPEDSSDKSKGNSSFFDFALKLWRLESLRLDCTIASYPTLRIVACLIRLGLFNCTVRETGFVTVWRDLNLVVKLLIWNEFRLKLSTQHRTVTLTSTNGETLVFPLFIITEAGNDAIRVTACREGIGGQSRRQGIKVNQSHDG